MDFSDLEVRGYVPGGGLLSPTGIFYLNIPKNASTFLTNVLVDNGWVYSIFDKSEHLINHCVIVLRDPVDRWISGFATYASSSLLSMHYGAELFIKDYNELSERLIFDNLSFDDHTAPQSRYIDQLPVGVPITYFKLTKKLISELGFFLGHPLVINPVDANISENNYDQNVLSYFMRKQIESNPVLKAKIIERYRNDFDLLANIKFYQGPRVYEPRQLNF